MADHLPPATLAALVVERMTLTEKLGEVLLRHSGHYENVDSGVARLCIPSLTLRDGPAGLAFGDSGVTQLPAPLGLAASFDSSLARQYGQLIAEEAAGQGIDVVQGPDLNIDRVPEDGRGFEGFGEDPLLASAMGDAEIEGIQSQGIMADAKHFAVYNQEANRGTLDAVVSERALQEIYLAPFRSAVKAGVASVMCAYPRLEGTFQCQDPALAQILSQWGFVGFVRSDEGAAHDLGAALEAGTDLLKPGSVRELEADVGKGALPMSTVDVAVERLLTRMFSYGLVGRPLHGAPGAKVDSAGHASVALQVAERSVVLLKNSRGTLPLKPSTLRSVAVIGAAASDDPVTAGHGSSHVTAPFTITPLDAIRARLAKTATVVYQDGASTTARLPLIPSAELTPSSGRGHGVTLTVGHLSGAPGVVSVVDPVSAVAVRNLAGHPIASPPLEGNPLPARKRDSGAVAGDGPPVGVRARGSQIVLPAGWGPSTVEWSGTLAVPRSGLYTFSLTGSGSATLSLDGRVAVDDSVAHGPGTWSSAIELSGRRHYRLRLSWVPLDNRDGTVSRLAVGMSYDSAAIEAAAEAARDAQVAVVVAAAESGETFDRPSLELPGDQEALIEAVAAANPHTVVVLETSGPVLMPWLHQVPSVLEAWYPGEQDGAAIAAIVTGDVDPSGHLPVTFPASPTASAVHSARQWPGVGLVSSYSEGLDVGYRYDHQTGAVPLFAFGFGLSYTTFAFSHLSVTPSKQSVEVSLDVTNIGRHDGGDAVQAYLTFPEAAGEPPGQLIAFSNVTLAAGQTTRVTMSVPRRALETYRASGWTTLPGQYLVGVGDSSASQPLHASFDVS